MSEVVGLCGMAEAEAQIADLHDRVERWACAVAKEALELGIEVCHDDTPEGLVAKIRARVDAAEAARDSEAAARQGQDDAIADLRAELADARAPNVAKGKEAEELRRAIERLLAEGWDPGDVDGLCEMEEVVKHRLQRILDRVDTRDSCDHLTALRRAETVGPTGIPGPRGPGPCPVEASGPEGCVGDMGATGYEAELEKDPRASVQWLLGQMRELRECRNNLDRYGSIYPPELLGDMVHTCPKCGHDDVVTHSSVPHLKAEIARLNEDLHFAVDDAIRKTGEILLLKEEQDALRVQEQKQSAAIVQMQGEILSAVMIGVAEGRVRWHMQVQVDRPEALGAVIAERDRLAAELAAAEALVGRATPYAWMRAQYGDAAYNQMDREAGQWDTDAVAWLDRRRQAHAAEQANTCSPKEE